MHESTVSRVTRSKLLQTPWGLFQMKDFFSSSVGPNENEEAHSAKTVRTLLKDIIALKKVIDLIVTKNFLCFLKKEEFLLLEEQLQNIEKC